jgi:hypothetical protein
MLTGYYRGAKMATGHLLEKRAKSVQVFNTQCVSLCGSLMDCICINYKKLYFYMFQNRRAHEYNTAAFLIYPRYCMSIFVIQSLE